MRCTANWRWYSRYSYRHTHRSHSLHGQPALVFKVLLQTHTHTQISCAARPTGAGIQGTPTDIHRSHALHGQLALVFKVLLQTQTQISRTYSNEESKIIQIIENIQTDQLRGFPTFKSEIDPHFSAMSSWLYLHVISFANTYHLVVLS